MATILESAPRAPRAEEPLYEVVRGRRVELPPMGAYPTEVASILSEYLGPFARQNGLGKVVVEMLFLIDSRSNLQRRPDVAFVSSARWPMRRPAPDTAAWEIVPDLAVEVVSPTDRFEDLLAKVSEFFQAGTRAVWVVSPRLRIVQVFESWTSVRVLTRADELDGGQIIPGFRLPLTLLFEDEETEATETVEPPRT